MTSIFNAVKGENNKQKTGNYYLIVPKFERVLPFRVIFFYGGLSLFLAILTALAHIIPKKIQVFSVYSVRALIFSKP
jgi:hypothetical protein